MTLKFPCCFAAIIASLGIRLVSQETTVNWDSVMKAAKTYISSPSTGNAIELYKELPKTGFTGKPEDLAEGSSFTRARRFIYENLPVLEKQVLKADRNSVKIAVRLWAMADGGFAESLSYVLGGLIRVDPEMFLVEFSYFPGSYDAMVSELRSAVCHGGILDPVKTAFEGGAVREELKMRIRALEAVKSEDLLVVKLRREAIAELKERERGLR